MTRCIWAKRLQKQTKRKTKQLYPVLFPEHPHRLYSFVVLVAFGPDKSYVKVAELLVIPTDEYVKGKEPPKRDAKDKFDALI